MMRYKNRAVLGMVRSRFGGCVVHKNAVGRATKAQTTRGLPRTLRCPSTNVPQDDAIRPQMTVSGSPYSKITCNLSQKPIFVDVVSFLERRRGIAGTTQGHTRTQRVAHDRITVTVRSRPMSLASRSGWVRFLTWCGAKLRSPPLPAPTSQLMCPAPQHVPP